jgi:hypothetical protein
MSFRWIRPGFVLVVTMFASAAPRAAMAQSTTSSPRNHLYDKFQASFDFTTVLNNGAIRVDGSHGLGTDLNYKDILGIPATTIQPALGVTWKPGKRTELQVGYQFLNQTGNRLFDKAAVIGDDTVKADFDVTTKLGESNATLEFRYSIMAAPKHNVGLAIGFGVILVRLDLVATARGCVDSFCDSSAVSVERKADGPTASLGAFGRWRVGERWYVGGDLRGLGARIDRYDATVLEGAAFGRYFLSDRWGLEVGWRYVNVDVNVAPKNDGSSTSDLAGNLKYDYSSLRLGVIAAF